MPRRDDSLDHALAAEPRWPECLRWGMREWCGRRERSERATVAYSTGASRAAAWHYELSPQRSVSGVEDPAGVGTARTCGTMSHHDGLIILPLPRLSSTVSPDSVLAIRGAIRAARVSSPKAMRSSLKSECSGTITIEGMPAFHATALKTVCGVPAFHVFIAGDDQQREVLGWFEGAETAR